MIKVSSKIPTFDVEANTKPQFYPNNVNYPTTAPAEVVLDSDDTKIISSGNAWISDSSNRSVVIDSVKGNSLKWNQLVKSYGTEYTVYGITRTINGNAVHYSGTSTNTTNFTGTSTIQTIAKHKYYLAANGCPADCKISIGGGATGTSKIIMSFLAVGQFNFGISIPNGVTIDADVFFVCVDLTLMFGADNEPSTVEDFETWLDTNIGLKDYYDYDPGSLISTKPTHIHTTSENISFDITKMKGINNGIEEVMFPDGLKRAGDVYDEIDFEHGIAIKRVGSVDLGSLTWGVGSQGGNLRASSSSLPVEAKTTSTGVIGNSINPYGFIPSVKPLGTANDLNMAIAYYNNSLYVRNDNWAGKTVEQIKSELSGVILYYELAEPITYKLPQLSPKYIHYEGLEPTEGLPEGCIELEYFQADAAFANAYNLVDTKYRNRLGSENLYIGLRLDTNTNRLYRGSSPDDLSINVPVLYNGDPCVAVKVINSDSFSITNPYLLAMIDVFTSSALADTELGGLGNYGLMEAGPKLIPSTSVKEVYSGTNLVWANYYGYDYNMTTGVMTRIGNKEWHRELPLQSKMRKAALSDSGVPKYISDSDYTKYEDGSTVDYTGGDGQIMTYIPEYYYKAYEKTINGEVHKILKLYPYEKIGKKSPAFWFGSFEAIADKETNRKLYSISLLKNMPNKVNDEYKASDFASANVYTTDVDNYRCGSADNNTASDGTVATRRGRSATNLTFPLFRTYAANRGTGWTQQYWTAYESIVRLYTVEYNSFNSQATFNSALTADGYKQGGLGAGVTNAVSARWNTFNGYNPFIPCGITKELGNNTGIIPFTFDAGEFGESTDAAYTTYVPCYRGIENIFGHIAKWADGCYYYGDSTNNEAWFYTCDDITKFITPSGKQATADGYKRRETSYTNGYIKDWTWDEDGEIIPKEIASSGYKIQDYAYLAYADYKAALLGGGASYGAVAGLACLSCAYGFTSASAGCGGRLCYTPQD